MHLVVEGDCYDSREKDSFKRERGRKPRLRYFASFTGAFFCRFFGSGSGSRPFLNLNCHSRISSENHRTVFPFLCGFGNRPSSTHPSSVRTLISRIRAVSFQPYILCGSATSYRLLRLHRSFASRRRISCCVQDSRIVECVCGIVNTRCHILPKWLQHVAGAKTYDKHGCCRTAKGG